MSQSLLPSSEGRSLVGLLGSPDRPVESGVLKLRPSCGPSSSCSSYSGTDSMVSAGSSKCHTATLADCHTGTATDA
jgi:hypothetical protein